MAKNDIKKAAKEAAEIAKAEAGKVKAAKEKADRAARLALATSLRTLFEPGSYGQSVSVSPGVTALRVAGGLTFTTMTADANGTIIDVHHQTRTAMISMKEDLDAEIEELSSEQK